MRRFLLPILAATSLSIPIKANYLFQFGNSTEWNNQNTPKGKSYRSTSGSEFNDSTDLFPSIYPNGKTIRDNYGNILDCNSDGFCYE